jgi:hypothetical protein
MAIVRDLTQHLLECLALDVWPRLAAIVDFGIDTQEHLGALQYAWKHGRTPEEFDAALGDGAKLTALCAVPGQPYQVKFATSWDRIGPEDAFMDDDDDDDDELE